LVREQYRAALWVLVLVALVASSLSAITVARAGSDPTYTLTGSVEQPNGFPVPANVQVDLVSRATGQVFTTLVATGGQFSFTTSSTGGALVPGYWGVWVPPQGNTSLQGCNPTKPYYQCAVLPGDQNPHFQFENATALTTSLYPVSVSDVTVLAYNGTLNGTVTSGGTPQPGAQVSLIDPAYNGFVFVNNTTASNGAFHLNVPFGTWVLKTTLPGASVRYNLTQVSIPSRTTVVVNPKVQNYVVFGYSNQPTGAHVPTAGNVTLWDPTNGYLYSSATPPGGFYSAGTYPANFVSGSQSFDVILSSIGYGTVWYPLTVSSPTPFQQNVTVSPLTASQYGRYQTLLDFSALNTTTGKGSLFVNTTAALGNDTVFPNLPNATVGQLWGQLGLDFDHSITFSQTSLPAVASFVNKTGPFFPAVQAQTAVNGTGFVGPTAPQTLLNWSSNCAGSCGLSSSKSLWYNWSQSYALNGTIPLNQSTYSISLGFAHPASSSDVYNYTFRLPTGYVLAAGTQAPSGTVLAPAGEGGTWTSFTLRSLPSTTLVGSAKFSVVKYAALSPIVNVTVSNFAFSKSNVLNSTQNNYTVEVGVGQNVTFSAINSLYPAGTNGTFFAWNFGDGHYSNVSTVTTNHTYSSTNGASSYDGMLTVTSSGGLKNSTKFFVWVAQGPVFANISVNSTAAQTKTTINDVTYLFVNWSTVLHFNASTSSALVTPTAGVKGVVAVASFVLTSSHGFKQTANYSASQGAYFWQNWTVQFLGAGNYLSAGTVGGNSVPFFGWQYNLTLTVWDGAGHFAKASLAILVNDTQKPTSAFQVLNAAGTPVKGSGVVAGTNLSAKVQLNGANATDPHNGSIVRYWWFVTNSGNASFRKTFNQTTVKPYPVVWLPASTSSYKVNLTVWDKNNNSGYATQSLTVSQNTTTSPIMAATNLTGPTSLTDGTTYTFWVNITVGGGTKAVATNISVAFYLLPPSGSGSRNYIGGSNPPGLSSSVKFYTYTSPGVVNSTSFATGLIPSLAWNKTVRAVITWNPSITGNFDLYANVTASNEFAGDYVNGPNVAKPLAITIGPNPTTQLLEYVAIAAAVVVVLFLIIVYYRRRTGKSGAKAGPSRSGLERSKRPADEEDDEDEDK